MSKISNFLLGDIDDPRHRKIIKWCWAAVFLLPLLGMLIFLALGFQDLPSVAELENPKNNEASVVLAADGSVLGRYYVENRVMVTYDELGDHLVNALISTEDERYHEHSGIDFYALGRAIIKTGILRDGASGGGSTISQQLAKLLFTEGGRDRRSSRAVVQKLREWVIAVRLERKYTKEEIIAMYLNRYDFINSSQGIRAAAENYFGKKPAELELQEAATLVGMLKNSSLFNPLKRPDMTKERRNVVLLQMERNGHLTTAEKEALQATDLGINYSVQKHDDGLAPYFRMVLREEAKKILAKPQYHKTDGEPYNVDMDGLTFHTTLDPRLQRHAEEQARKHMAGLQKQFFRHWRGEDPWTYESPVSETETSVAARQNSLTKDIRRSDRYQNLRRAILLPAIQKINAKSDLTFHADDREVSRMVADLKDKSTIRDLENRDLLSKNLAREYRRVMKMDEFTQLRDAWTKLQDRVEKQFNQPVEGMRVFTYDRPEMETDTTMTPLDSVRYHRMILQIGSIAVEPRTGYVRAWIGGSNFKWFQFDHVTTRRQVGSTFKPFIYAASIDLRGISPCFEVLDAPVTIAPGDGSFYLNEPWTPRNASGQYSGEYMNLYYALKNSVNTVSAYLMRELGSPEPVRTLVSNMGIPKEQIPPVPSIALGSVELTARQLTGAYTTFGNNGTYNEPIMLTKITDRTGRVVYEYIPENRRAISPAANYVMVDMLRKASVGALGGVKGPVGGKTGTTNDQTDGWYMGLTPELVVGTWVGGDNRWIRFRSLGYGSGANMAKPFFRQFVSAAQRDESVDWNTKRDFHRPRGSLGIELDCEAYSSGDDPLEDEEDDNLGPDLDTDVFGGGGLNNSPDF